MATNVRYDKRSGVRVELTVGASQESGEVIFLNDMPVFLLEDSDDDNKATVELIGVSLVVELSVTGKDGSGNSTVAVGDKLYLDGTEYNKDDANGSWIGYALEGVTSGATATIDVALIGAVAGADIDGLTATAGELNLNDGQVASATFVVGAEDADVINVAVQLKDAAGADMAIRSGLPWYLSSDANGDALATAPNGGIAIGTDGLLIETLDNQAGIVISEADGDIDVDITDTGTPTMYLVLVLPNGKLAASGAITFAN